MHLRAVLGLSLALILGAAACSSDAAQIEAPTESAPADSATRVVEAPAATPVVAPTTAAAPAPTAELVPPPAGLGPDLALPGERGRWTGTIDGTIGIELWLAQTDDHVRGEIVYTSVGIPITVLGKRLAADGGSYFLRELGPDGRVSGNFNLSGASDGVITSANWGELDMNLDYQGVDDEPYFFDPLVRDGEYRYAFAPFGDGDTECCGPSGRMNISEVSDSTLTMEFWSTTSGPSFNIASISPVQIPLNGNRALYERVEGDFIDCAIQTVVFDGFAFVDYLDERWDCGFGHRASVTGFYVLPGRFG